MRVTHTLTIVGTCPVDGTTDVYELVVTTSRIVRVEDIIDAARIATSEPAMQEGIAAGIKAHFGDIVNVRLTGTHSGVKTTVEL